MSAPAVKLVKVSPRTTAVVAQTTTWAEFPSLWGRLLGEVYGFVRGRPELATGSGGELWQNVMLYKDQRPDVEVGVLVTAPFEPEGRVIASELPAGEVATATHRGDYALLGATHDAVRDHVASVGRELAGPCWEIYGHASPDPDEQTTDVFWLLRPPGRRKATLAVARCGRGQCRLLAHSRHWRWTIERPLRGQYRT